MRRKLFTVTDCFKIAGRGTVVVGKRPTIVPNIKIGNPILLISPEGREIKTEASGIQLPTTISGTQLIALLVLNLTKNEIPIGTEVILEA